MNKKEKFPSPNLGLSLKSADIRPILADVSFRPLIWGYL